MRTKESILKLLDFSILKSNCVFIHSDTDDELNESLPIDMDCDIMFNEKENRYQIIISLDINKDQVPGYNIHLECVGFFSFLEKISTEERGYFLQYSGLQMCISNMRGYVANITSYYPLGKFVMPTIDLNDFIDKKIESAKMCDSSVEV